VFLVALGRLALVEGACGRRAGAGVVAVADAVGLGGDQAAVRVGRTGHERVAVAARARGGARVGDARAGCARVGRGGAVAVVARAAGRRALDQTAVGVRGAGDQRVAVTARARGGARVGEARARLALGGRGRAVAELAGAARIGRLHQAAVAVLGAGDE